jgi:hypothetical protein
MKYLSASTRLHGAISQVADIFITLLNCLDMY